MFRNILVYLSKQVSGICQKWQIPGSIRKWQYPSQNKKMAVLQTHTLFHRAISSSLQIYVIALGSESVIIGLIWH